MSRPDFGKQLRAGFVEDTVAGGCIGNGFFTSGSSMIRHVIWDWNGTLLDDVDACVGAINRMLPLRGLPLVDSDRYRRVFDFPVIRYYETLGFDLAAESWDAVAVEFHAHYAELSKSSRLREGIREVLDRLHAAGVSMSVLSASETAILNRMLEEHGIARYFGQVRGLDNLYASSKLETGRMHLRELNMPSGQIMLVGDTLHDREVAEALGIRCLLVAGGHQHEDRLSAFALLNTPQELFSQLGGELMAYDVFFYEAFAEEAEALRAYLPAEVSAGYASGAIQECRHDVPPAAVISIRTQSRIPNAWRADLKAVISRSTGYDHLSAYARRTGTTAQLGYLPLYCARAVAEQALLLWLSLQRKLLRQVAQFRCFERDHLTGQETQGKRLLVVGAGNIGGEVIKIGQGLGMQVQAVDPVRKHEFADYVLFEEALPEADIIVCAMSLNDGNRGFFSLDTLGCCKPGALFVNIARGELSPPADLLQLLKQKRLGGVALDVYDEEQDLAVALRGGHDPRSASSRAVLELAAMPNAICTPHNAFNTAEAVQRKSEQTVQQIAALRTTGSLLWKIPEESK